MSQDHKTMRVTVSVYDRLNKEARGLMYTKHPELKPTYNNILNFLIDEAKGKEDKV